MFPIIIIIIAIFTSFINKPNNNSEGNSGRVSDYDTIYRRNRSAEKVELRNRENR